jgi:hypothetical protein
MAYNLNPTKLRNWENFKTWCKANDVSVRKAVEDMVEEKLRGEGIPIEKLEVGWE